MFNGHFSRVQCSLAAPALPRAEIINTACAIRRFTHNEAADALAFLEFKSTIISPHRLAKQPIKRPSRFICEGHPYSELRRYSFIYDGIFSISRASPGSMASLLPYPAAELPVARPVT